MNTDAGFKSEIFRKNNPIIIAANRMLARISGVRLKYDSGGYLAGTVLARKTSTGIYEKYNDSASGGVEVAKGILLDELPADEMLAASGGLGRLLYGGDVFKSALTGLDAAAETDLKARSIIDGSGTEILSF